MTNTLDLSMADIIPEPNVSFNGGDLSSDTGAMLLLDFLSSNKPQRGSLLLYEQTIQDRDPEPTKQSMISIMSSA